jgi:mycoredoxin
VVSATGSGKVRLYWRPGCPFCMTLRWRLRRLGIEAEEINIWEDAEAAAVVRRITGGNETVPTVVVGDRAMVNPSGRAVRDALARSKAG